MMLCECRPHKHAKYLFGIKRALQHPTEVVPTVCVPIATRGMSTPHVTGSHHKQSTRLLSPRSPSNGVPSLLTAVQHDTAAAARSPVSSRSAFNRVPRRSRFTTWQVLTLTVAVTAAIGLVAWFHHAAALIPSATNLIHLPEHFHHARLDTLANLTDTRILLHNNSQLPADDISPVLLFDDSAKLAMEAQQRQRAASKAKKEQAREKGINYEWQRHSHLVGSVYAKSSTAKG